MKIIGKVGQRIVNYLKFDRNSIWHGNLPNSNWAVVIISDDSGIERIDEIICKCLNNNVLYISSIGKQSKIIEDIADENIVLMDLNDNIHPITTSHNKKDEGLWFATVIANHSESEINEVVIIDMVQEDMYDNLVEQIKYLNVNYL